MTKERAREIAEALVILHDESSIDWIPVAEFIAAIHEIEEDLLNGNTESYVVWLEEGIEESALDEDNADYVSECKRVLALIEKGE